MEKCKEKCKDFNSCCNKCYNDFIEFRGKKTECNYKKEKVIRFFSIDGYYDEKSFLMGQKSSFKDKNPFYPSTNSWFNWNRGKNTNSD